MIVSPSLSIALHHSTDIYNRVAELKYFLKDLQYLFVNFKEYENGLSNRYSLTHVIKDLKAYSHFSLSQYAETNDKTFLLTSQVVDNIVLLGQHYLECVKRVEDETENQ